MVVGYSCVLQFFIYILKVVKKNTQHKQNNNKIRKINECEFFFGSAVAAIVVATTIWKIHVRDSLSWERGINEREKYDTLKLLSIPKILHIFSLCIQSITLYSKEFS